jgi:hypothetical protein
LDEPSTSASRSTQSCDEVILPWNPYGDSALTHAPRRRARGIC